VEKIFQSPQRRKKEALLNEYSLKASFEMVLWFQRRKKCKTLMTKQTTDTE
jgi:hypothetical protein